MSEQQRAEYEAHAATELAKGRCPHSGLPLSPPFIDAWEKVTRACQVCDCFGYDPSEVGDE